MKSIDWLMASRGPTSPAQAAQIGKLLSFVLAGLHVYSWDPCSHWHLNADF
jgi:hypothetical protein